VADLAAFVIASPSSFHAAAEGARRLAEALRAERGRDEAADELESALRAAVAA
jgi:aspartyl aminopeptidase